MSDPRIFVIHENDEWLPPLRQGFKALGVPYGEWYLNKRALDLRSVTPEDHPEVVVEEFKRLVSQAR